MAETVINPIRENLPAKEKLTYNPEQVGLQVRLLAGNQVLDHTYSLPDAKSEIEKLITDPDRKCKPTYELLAKLSTDERIKHWEARAAKDDSLKTATAQKATWLKEVVEIYNDKNDTSYRDLFSQSNICQGAINWKNFDAAEAEKLYQRYFLDSSLTPITRDGKTTYLPSSVVKYISDLVADYAVVTQGADGKETVSFKHTKLQKDLSVIQNFSSIFGNNYSDEILAQLMDVEIKDFDPHKRQELLDSVVAKEKVGAEEKIRGNNLRSREVELLEALNGAGKYKEATSSAPGPQPPDGDNGDNPEEWPEPREWPEPEKSKPLPTGHEWSYEKAKPNPENPSEVRQFPEANLVEEMVNPAAIAHKLKLRDARTGHNQYASISEIDLAGQIQSENNQLKNQLAKIGLDNERLIGVLNSAMAGYRTFVENKYHIKMPDIGHITILPIWGKTAEYYDPNRGALAFVIPTIPAIFMDMGVIRDHAKSLAQNWEDLTPEGFRNLMIRVFEEIRPHETTHLSADLAFWYAQEQPSGKKEKVQMGKLGPWMTKPVGLTDEGQIIIKERGRGLMEATTVELTKQWAQSMNSKLDVDAYRAERAVLHDLITQMMEEQNISFDTAFTKFVNAYFTRTGFGHLASDLAGRHTEQEPNGKAIAKTFRPHYLSIVDALMEYESHEAAHGGRGLTYSLTRSYIHNNLTEAQKQEILNLLTTVESAEGTTKTGENPAHLTYLSLPQGIRDYLRTKDPRIVGEASSNQTPSKPEPAKPETPPAATEVHSLDEIISQSSAGLAKAETTNMVLKSDESAVIIPAFLPILEKKIKEKGSNMLLNFLHLKAAGNPTLEIASSRAKGHVVVDIGIPFQPKLTIDFVAANSPTGNTVFNSVKIEPPVVGGINVQESASNTMAALPINEALAQYISQELSKKKSGLVIEDLKIQFTPDNKTLISVKGKKK